MVDDDTRTTMVLHSEKCTQNRAFAGILLFGAEWSLIDT